MFYLAAILFTGLVLYVVYQIWLAWPGIIATARAQADMMEDMNPLEAAQFSFLGHVPRHERNHHNDLGNDHSQS